MSRKGYPQYATRTERGHVKFTSDIDGSVTTDVEVNADYTSFHADRIGANTVGWPHARGNNAYTAYRVTNEFEPAHFTGHNFGNLTSGFGSYPSQYASGVSDPADLFDDFGPEIEQLREQLVSRIATKVKDQKINVAVAAAEFKQTCNTVTSAATRIAQAMRLIKQGRLGAAASTLGGGLTGRGKKGRGAGHGGKRPRGPNQTLPSSGSVQSDWLSYQYGWTPLMSDVFGACEELARTLTYQPPAYRVTSGANGTFRREVLIPPSGPFPSYSGFVEVSASLRGTVEYAVGLEMAQKASNTGIVDPLSLAWELIPYSFVVDWFLPVGNYLNNLGYDFGLVFNKGWITTKTTGHYSITGQPGGPYGPDNLQWSGGSVKSRGTGFQRDPLGGFPTVSPPSFKDPTSLLHVANAIALVGVAFKG